MSSELIEKVAGTAKIELSEDEKRKFGKDMESILKAFDSLGEADINGVEPAFQPIEVKNVLREDKIEKSLSQDEALANTKHREKGFFKGPRVV